MVSFSLIGCGRIGERHAEHILKQGRLVAVCDIDEEKAKRLAKKYSVPYQTDYEEMLKTENKPDAVAVCTPNGLHAQHSIASLKAGFHVLYEKPMAIRVATAGK